jgi:hypothetical protein
MESTWPSVDKTNLELLVIVCQASTYRIFGDISALQNKLQKMLLREGLHYRREFECSLQDKNNIFREVTMKITDKELSFCDIIDENNNCSFLSSEVLSLKSSNVPELKHKYESLSKILELELANGISLLLGADDLTIQSIEQEIQNIILLLWRNYKTLDDHKKRINTNGVPCKIFSRNKAKTCDVTFRISNDKFVIQDEDQDILIEVPINQISGWVFGFNLVNSIEGVLLFSKKSVDSQYQTLEHMMGTLQQNYSDNFFESSSDGELY